MKKAYFNHKMIKKGQKFFGSIVDVELQADRNFTKITTLGER